MKIGIIGGSGLYNIEGLSFVENIDVDTEYGKPSDKYKIYRRGELDYYFLARHGENIVLPRIKLTIEQILQDLRN